MKKPCIWPSKRRCATGTPALSSRVGVQLALVAQHVVLGGDDDGGRQPGQVGGAQRRGIRMQPGRGVGRVVVPEPGHGLAGQQQVVGRILVGRGGEVGVGDGVDQDLGRDGRAAGAGPPRDDGREVAARAVARDDQRDLRPGDVEQVIRGPAQRGQLSSTAVGYRYSGASR